MALRNGFTRSYSLAKSGVDFWHDLKEIPRENSPYMKNCYFRDGIVQRLGTLKLASSYVEFNKAVTALHRFYYGTNSKQLLVASGNVIARYNGGVWTDIITGLTDSAPVTFQTWGPKDAVYIANGTNQPRKWDGTTETILAIFPSNVRQFLPLLDRMLWIDSQDPSSISSNYFHLKLVVGLSHLINILLTSLENALSFPEASYAVTEK